MKHYRPAYYKDFRCIASECSDNCCIGWEIDIDENSAAFYRSVGGDFGCRLKQNIFRDENGSQFILKGERCPFLNEKNLCDIYIHLGESALCEICTQHPRYHEWYGDWKESGVGLCCEAAGRLIFSQNETAFELIDIDEEAGEAVDESLFSALFIARETAMKLIQRQELSFGERLALLQDFADELQEALDFEDIEGIRSIAKEYAMFNSIDKLPIGEENALNNLLDFLSGLEPIDPEWPALLQHIKENLQEVLSAHRKLQTVYPNYQKEMEQLAIYFIFRYFCKALFDGDVRSRTMLCSIACAIVSLLDGETFLRKGSFSLEDRIFTAKQFSKEIEYCTENLEALADHCWQEDFSVFDVIAAVMGDFA